MDFFEAHKAKMLAHLQALHKTPGWAEYVEAKVADMAARHPDLYAELAAQFPKQRRKSSAGLPNGGR